MTKEEYNELIAGSKLYLVNHKYEVVECIKPKSYDLKYRDTFKTKEVALNVALIRISIQKEHLLGQLKSSCA